MNFWDRLSQAFILLCVLAAIKFWFIFPLLWWVAGVKLFGVGGFGY